MSDTDQTLGEEHNRRFDSLAAFASEGGEGEEFTDLAERVCTTYVHVDQPAQDGREVVVLVTRAAPSRRPVEFVTTGQCARLDTSPLALTDVEDPVVLGTGHSDFYSAELLRAVHEHGIRLWRSTEPATSVYGAPVRQD